MARLIAAAHGEGWAHRAMATPGAGPPKRGQGLGGDPTGGRGGRARGLCRATVRLHLETTAGVYTQGGFGAFIRNVPIRLEAAAVRGSGPYRVGPKVDDGWVHAEGLTHGERDTEGRVQRAGHDADGRLTVACRL